MSSVSTSKRDGARRRLSAGERRARILDAATEVFAEHGYAAASMGEIAARAGVVASVLYDHFGSKRELHIELLQLHGEELIRRSIGEVEGDPGAELQRASLEAYFRFVEEDPFVWRFLFRDPPNDPEIAAAWRRLHDRATAGIVDLIRLGAPHAGAPFDLPDETATWMLAKAAQSATNGLAQWWWEHREVPRQQVTELAMALLWEGFEGLLGRVPAAGGSIGRAGIV
ncbi:MAG TPA: TetR/AcrR family transcriptional regulator [Solirubrobacterales bacterium]|nr:TetR/AcrR family transcriptional regulator [Solirubrobacterales bacterium]